MQEEEQQEDLPAREDRGGGGGQTTGGEEYQKDLPSRKVCPYLHFRAKGLVRMQELVWP